MNATNVVFSSDLSCLPLLCKGKVRDIYAIDAKHLLIVSSDRLSAFDVVLPSAIAGKGRVLTNISNFWFGKLAGIIDNHLTDIAPAEVVHNPDDLAKIAGRAIVVKRLKPLPLEAIVRGYLVGSGWLDYQANGAVCGITLPKGLTQAAKLPQAIYTPSSKALPASHDENINFAQTAQLLGENYASQIKQISLEIYRQAADYARQKGIIIADSKFEFGTDAAGKLYLIDELLTPDSSRFWLASDYQTGCNPPSFDKQYIRDYLQDLHWNKQAPAPTLPPEVIQVCANKYASAERMLLG